MHPYLWFSAHLQVGTDRVEGSCPTHIDMGVVERQQHFYEICTLPLMEQKQRTHNARFIIIFIVNKTDVIKHAVLNYAQFFIYLIFIYYDDLILFQLNRQ